MSQTLYHPINVDSPSQAFLEYTVDNTFTSSFVFAADPFSVANKNAIIRKQRLPKKGTARGFKPKIHDIVPALKNLTHEDLEKLIGQRYRDNLDD
jgi:hypothetical protein